jgi:hypothetical protein
MDSKDEVSVLRKGGHDLATIDLKQRLHTDIRPGISCKGRHS